MNPHPALIFDPDHDHHYPEWVEVAPGVQYAAINTRDWRLRSRYSSREVSSWDDFVRGLESRCSFFVAQYPVPDNLDVRFARCYSEMSYAAKVAGISDDPFLGAHNVVPEMLMLSPQQLGVTQDGQIEWRSQRGDRGLPHYRPDRHLRGEERRHRHRLGAFISYQDREVGALFPRPVFSRYLKVPSWWPEHEVPYQFRAQAPPVLTYRGILFMSRHSYGWDLVLRAEWAAMCAVELYSQALEGFLWWLPPRVIDDIERIGVSYMFDGANRGIITDIRSLLWEIKCIRWGRVTNVNRYIPRFAQEPTPTYDNGDFVEFDVDAWQTRLSSDMYLSLDADNNPIGNNERGQRMYGSTEGWPSYNNPVGRQAGLDEQERQPGYRLNERYGYSQTKWGIARSVVRNLAEQHGVISLLQDLGRRGPLDPKTFMEHYRELLLEKVESSRNNIQGQGLIGGNNAPQLIEDVPSTLGDSTPRVGTPRVNVSRGNTATPIPVVDLTSSGLHEQAELSNTPRLESLPGSVADHASLGQRSVAGPSLVHQSLLGSSGVQHQSGVQPPQQQVQPVGEVLASGVVSSVVPQDNPDFMHQNLETQAYVELVREGKLDPFPPHPRHARFGPWKALILSRTVHNNAIGSPFPRNARERPIVRIDNALIQYASVPTSHVLPTRITEEGMLVGDGVSSGPSQVRNDDPVTAAQAAVSEAQQASGIRSSHGR